MRKMAAALVLFGSGLVAFGVTGFSGEFSANTRFSSGDQPYEYSGSLGWSTNDRIETTIGVILITLGMIQIKKSN